MYFETDLFDRALAALLVCSPIQEFSKVLSIIEASTDDEISKCNESFFSTRSRHLDTVLLNDTLKCLITRLPNDDDNMGSFLSILNYFYSFLRVEYKTIRRFGLPNQLGKILKSHRHDKIIIHKCLRLLAKLCERDILLAKHIVTNEINLNIIESIVHILRLVLENEIPSETTLKLSLSSLHRMFIIRHPPQHIFNDYRIGKVLGYAIVKFIDDWKTSEENHDARTWVLDLLQFCSEYYYKNLSFELKNTGGGDAMLLLSDLILIPEVTDTVTMIVLNLQAHHIHYSHVPLDDIYGKMIEKLEDTNGTDDELYELFLDNFCILLEANNTPENLIVTATVSLLNALRSYVRPTEASFRNCKTVMTILQQDQLKGCLRLMLDNGILGMLSSKLDWIFGVENQLDMHHNEYEYSHETNNYELYTKRELAFKIVNLIECFANLKPAALELGTSDIVYKLLLFFLPKNESLKFPDLMLTIRNIITKPELLINLLMQTQFVYTVHKFIPEHSNCDICIDLFEIRNLITWELTKIVESTIEKDDIAHNLYTASPTVKETLVVALPFFAEKMSTLNTVMINCGGLDLVIDSFRRETARRQFLFCSLKALAHKIEIKDPTDCSFIDNNDEVATVLKIENYQPSAGLLVTFELDDDSCVQANRELLASKSDFFNRLLFGQFREANLEVVRLQETPHDPFKLVLMLLQLDDIATDDKLCRNGGKPLEDVDLTVVLEAILLCDRFFFEELYTSLTRFLIHCQFSIPLVIDIHRWLFDLPTDILRTEIISYCLVGCMSEVQRSCLLDELLKPEFQERFLDDMRNMFRRFLCASCD